MTPKQQRNAPCSCNSGKKYKKCHLLIEREEAIKAEAEWNAKRITMAEERQRQREEHKDSLRESGLSRTHGSPINPWIISAMCMAAMSGPTTIQRKRKP